MAKKTIAVFTAPQGHESIADTIINTLKSKYVISKFLEENIFYDTYRILYKYLPFVGTSLVFTLIKDKKAIDLTKKILFKYNKKSLSVFINKNKPDIFINTHYFFSPFLEKYSQENNIPFINILTDPKTIHPILVSKNATLNLAFDKKAIEISKKFNPQANILESGWFIRDEYEKNYKKESLRKNLKVSPDKLTFLIVSGSDGTTAIMKILPILFNTRKNINILVACGNNKTLYKSVIALQKFTKKIKSKVNITPLKFTKKLYKYMQVADLVIGKAGPNTLFESVATLTPFFAITHISGQEDGNLDIIRDYNLGYVEENPIKASKMLMNIIDNPKQLDKFQNSLEKMKKYNQKSKTKLLKLINKLLEI